jgi:hypothetical protein
MLTCTPFYAALNLQGRVRVLSVWTRSLGMWQTMTILQCPPRQTLLPDPTVKT